MNEYKLHQVFSTKIGDSSTSQTAKKRTSSRRRPRSLGLQATALPGAAARGSRRLRGRGCAAAYGDDGSGAVGKDDRGRWAGEGRFPYKKKVVTVEVTVQGISGVKMMKFQFFFFWGGNGQQSGYAMCDMLCGILAQVRESQPCVKHLHHKNRQKWWQYMVRCPDTSIILLMKISYTSSWQNIPSFTGFNRFDKFAFPISQLNWCQGYTPEI